MNRELADPTSDALSDDILTAMHEWRLQHPDATLTEIEHALDERWYRLRARMLHDLALEREVANWQAKATERPTCPTVAARSSAAVASHANSKPMAATT